MCEMTELIKFSSRLRQELKNFESLMMNLINSSTIEYRSNRSRSMVIISPHYYWGKPDENQRALQLRLRESYTVWHQLFLQLFKSAPEDMLKRIDETNKFVMRWIEKESDWSIPSSVEEARLVFQERIQVLYEFIQMLDEPDLEEVVVVPDTDSLVLNPDFTQFAGLVGKSAYTVVILPTVLYELDLLKRSHREKKVREKVSSVIKKLKDLKEKGSLLKGIKLDPAITVKILAREPDFSDAPNWLDSSIHDDRMIASTLEIQRKKPSALVVLVTSRINLQNKAELSNLPFLEPPE